MSAQVKSRVADEPRARAPRATEAAATRASSARLTSRDWKRLQPTSLRHAMELSKDYARECRNLSVERIADHMGLADHFYLYKVIQSGRLPAILIRPFEAACGVDYVSRWIAASAGKLLIDIPSGRKLKGLDVVALHHSFSAALQLLTALYEGKADQAEVQAALTDHLVDVAWHRQNVIQFNEPELDFGA